MNHDDVTTLRELLDACAHEHASVMGDQIRVMLGNGLNSLRANVDDKEYVRLLAMDATIQLLRDRNHSEFDDILQPLLAVAIDEIVSLRTETKRTWN